MDFSMFENIPDAYVTDKKKHSENTPSNSVSDGRFPERTPLAMAYVPCQQWGETYNIENGFERGTVFPELDLPFSPGEGCV